MRSKRLAKQIRSLHDSLIEIVSALNRPRNDEKMIDRAGVRLDRALFPLLVAIERLGPIGVVDLSERVGRDYSTVSRHAAKLETLGLVARDEAARDRRIHQARITSKGKVMTAKIDAAREALGIEIFQSWDLGEVDDFVRLIRKFADAIQDR